MKNRLLILTILTLSFFSFDTPSSDKWDHNLDTALQKAKKEGKPILMVFSGSDWCRPCMQLKQTVFATPEFKAYAVDALILLEVDFPRKKKNRLSKEQIIHNETLAEKYNPKGYFPQVLLLDKNGNTKKVFNLPITTAADFLTTLKSINH